MRQPPNMNFELREINLRVNLAACYQTLFTALITLSLLLDFHMDRVYGLLLQILWTALIVLFCRNLLRFHKAQTSFASDLVVKSHIGRDGIPQVYLGRMCLDSWQFYGFITYKVDFGAVGSARYIKLPFIREVSNLGFLIKRSRIKSKEVVKCV